MQILNCANRSYAVAEGVRYADERGIDQVSAYKYEERMLPYSIAPSRTRRDTKSDSRSLRVGEGAQKRPRNARPGGKATSRDDDNGRG